MWQSSMIIQTYLEVAENSTLKNARLKAETISQLTGKMVSSGRF